MEKNQILTIYGKNYQEMAVELMRRADLSGMIGDKAKQVGVKPNLVVAKPAESGATTHPEIVAGVLQYLQEEGFTNICVLEGSWVGDRTDIAYRTSGIGAVCQRYQVPYLDLQKDSSRTVSLCGEPYKVCEQALALDYLINLPVLKGHCQTTMTCALKNHKGLIPNSEKRRFHTMGLHRPIAYLGTAFPNEFILVDNICGDLDFEEGGNPVQMDRLLGCVDPVLCDAFACETMGYDISEVPYIAMAEKLGAGSADLQHAQVIALNECVAGSMPHPSRRVRELAAHIEAKDACSACYGSLIHALSRMEESGELRAHRGKICIGQGYKGENGGDIGVGQCTRGCACSLKGCPPTAAEMLSFLEENWK